MKKLFDTMNRLWKGRREIAVGTLAAGVLAVTYSLIASPVYRAKATIIPLSQSGSSFASALASPSAIPLLNALGSSLGLGGSEQKLMVLLKSRTLAENVIKNLELSPVLRSGKPIETSFDMEEAVILLQRKVRFERKREGLYEVMADFPDRNLAARVVSTYLEELQKLINKSSLTLAKKNRLFIEEQLKNVKENLAQAEDAFRTFQESHGVISLDTQTEFSLQTIADLEGSVIGKDLEIASLSRISTSDNPDLQRLREEKRALEEKLRNLKTGNVGSPTKKKRNDNPLMLSMGNAPEVGLGFLRLKRDVMIREKAYELLSQQYELARIEEVRDDVAFQIIDPAIPPQFRLSPQRKLNTLVGLVAGLLLSATWILTSKRYDSPDLSERNLRVMDGRS